MIVAEVLLMLDLASGSTDMNALAPMEMLFLVGLLLIHPRIGMPAYSGAASRGRLKDLQKRLNKLICWQCELENYAEVKRIHYKDIILRQWDCIHPAG
jgi:hypothetical protein